MFLEGDTAVHVVLSKAIPEPMLVYLSAPLKLWLPCSPAGKGTSSVDMRTAVVLALVTRSIGFVCLASAIVKLNDWNKSMVPLGAKSTNYDF